MLMRYYRTNPTLPLWGESFWNFPNTARLANELFRDFESRLARPSSGDRARIQEYADHVEVTADVPGCKMEDVHVAFDDGVLTISARRAPPSAEGYRAVRRERDFHVIQASYRVACKVAADQAKATLRDGRLVVTLPKAPEATPKTIEIRGT